jgi:hypothetical protein
MATKEEEDYQFDDPRKSVCELLQQTEAPGSFVTSGDCSNHSAMLLPGLVVRGLGQIGLPLSDGDAKALADLCQQAPFGRGADTLVDTAVRNTKQLAPEHFSITNPNWEASLKH